MADQQYSQYPAGQAGNTYGSYTGDSSYSESGYASANTGAYTIENPDDDPDYEPSVAMEDQESEETQSATEDVPASAETVASEIGVQEPPSHTESEETQSATEDVPSSAETAASEVGVQEPPSHTTAAAAESKPIRASQGGLDDDGQNCGICFERWTISSEHRLVSLKCGHLFGRNCISRMLKGRNARCPQCNAPAREAEIINIYAKSLKFLDRSEHDKVLEDLAKEVTARRNADLTAVRECLKHGLAVQVCNSLKKECRRLKKKVMDAEKQLQEYRVNELPQEPPAEILRGSCSLSFIINSFPERKLIYCDKCGVKYAAIIVTVCFECGAPRFL